MHTLEDKYIANSLTQDELLALREKVNLTDDQDLSLDMKKQWDLNSIDNNIITDDLVHQIRKNVRRKVRPSTPRIMITWSRVAQIAAAVVIPMLVITSIYFYRSSMALESQDLVILTGIGERANIVLPDGTRVAINSESKLSYSPHSYNKKSRTVDLEGEAYFEVTKDPDKQFVITTNDIQVTVLGTTFNLSSRNETPTVELNLLTGQVLFHALKAGTERKLKSSQRAVLDKATGSITVTDIIESQVAKWKIGELYFHNATLNHVIETIEKHYSLKIDITSNSAYIEDLFSGTIPTSDLLEALKIIEEVYHFKSEISGKTIHLIDNP